MPDRSGPLSGGGESPPLFSPLLAGLVASIPFQKNAPGILVFCALVPFFLLLRFPGGAARIRDAFRTGWIFGFGFFIGLLYWIGLLSRTAIPIRGLAFGGLFLLAAWLALFPAIFALLLRLSVRAVPLWIAAPVAWGAIEHIRSLGSLGFPWGALGYALIEQGPLIQIARLGSVDAVTFLVVLVNVLLALSVEAVARRRLGRTVLCFAAAVLAVFAVGLYGVKAIRGGASVSGKPVRVAVVQPNIAADVKWSEEYKEESLQILSDLTREAAAGGDLDLVVWPETAVPIYVRHEARYFRRIMRLAEEVGTPILYGFPDADYDTQEGYRYFNAAMLLDEEGSVLGEYRKIHLVPFGERLPLHGKVDWITRLDMGEADFTPGEETTLFRGRGGTFSVNICYEAIFPSLCRRSTERGARYLVNLTNDAWFGTTSAPHQHAAMARFRSVELGVWLARSANTGISLFADPAGRVVESLGLFERGYAVADIYPAVSDTFYARHGDWLPRLEMVLTLLILAAAIVRRMRRTGRHQ